MKSRILGFAGHKQSGKTTCCNFLHGYQLRAQRIIDDFAITDEGKLVIDTDMVLPDGQEQKSKGLLDVKRSDLEFAEWAAYSMWPYIKHYSFSDPLKQISIGLFGLNPRAVLWHRRPKKYPNQCQVGGHTGYHRSQKQEEKKNDS